MKRRTIAATAILLMIALPSTSADGDEPTDPDPLIACAGAFYPPTTPTGASATGMGPYAGQAGGVRVVGIAMAYDGDGSPGGHTHFVVVGGATDPNWCEKNHADEDVAGYWTRIACITCD